MNWSNDGTPRALVVDAGSAAAADAAAIAAGIPSRALMRCAGAAAAAEIARRFSALLADGVVIATGAGNNGGDGWVVAQCLHTAGVGVRVVECAEARTADARAEREAALALGVPVTEEASTLADGSERLVVDALLGTGFRADSALRDPIARAVTALVARNARGATVVSLDVPSGLDASTGASRGELCASLTLTFGTVKRGQLAARER